MLIKIYVYIYMELKSIYNENILVDINNLNIFLKNKQGNIDDYLLKELKNKIGNKCNRDGLLIKKSIQIIFRNCGEFAFNEKILYRIKYSANILYPTEGCLLQNCRIVFTSNALYIAKPDKLNCIILIPKNFIENREFKMKKIINVVCLDKYYELNDKFMIIIGIPHFNNSKQEFIQNNSSDDSMCQNILEDFQKSEEYDWVYEKYFKDKEEEEFELFEIDYTSNSSVSKGLTTNFILKNVINEINEILKTKKLLNINTINITSYEDVFNIIDHIIDSNISLYINNIYTNYRYFLSKDSPFDIIQYNKLLDKQFDYENKSSYQIQNNETDCYIISAIYILHNCKIFRKKLQESLLETGKADNYIELIKELHKLIILEKTDISDFKKILRNQIEFYKYNFDLNKLQNVYDFINILFLCIDNKYENILGYIYNVYDDVSISPIPEKKNDTNNISYYINKLEEKRSGILEDFYSITVNEYECSECNFRYYHIKNAFTFNIDISGNNTIANCIHHSSKTPNHVNGLYCSVCNAESINKLSYIYKNPQEYLLFDLNRIIFDTENAIKKNKTNLFINNRIYMKFIDKNTSIKNIKFNNYILDLKSIICHYGTVTNGHYFTLNKNMSKFFDLYIDNTKYIVRSQDFYNTELFKQTVSNVVYQINNIDNPMSDIHLLLYEDSYLNNNVVDFDTFISNEIYNDIGYKMDKMLGGSNIKENKMKVYPLEELYNSNIIKNKKTFINTLNRFFNDTSIILNGSENEDEILEKIQVFYINNIKNINYILPEIYNAFIKLYVDNIKNSLFSENKNTISFLEEHTDFINNKNIYIGSTGYNSHKTNHWDVIYQSQDNFLKFYSSHFNSIEINDNNYNETEKINWNNINKNIEDIEDNFTISIVFNSEFTNMIEKSENENLEKNIEMKFDNYWNERIQLIENRIENIVFIFNSTFEYNIDNFNKLKILNNKILNKYKTKINFIFELYDNSWYINNVMDYFIGQGNLFYASLIINNDNNDFGFNFNSEHNFNIINEKDFTMSYIKLYGSKNKYNGNHTNDLYKIISTVKKFDVPNTKFMTPLNKLTRTHFIYFNNIETNFNNIRYEPKYSSDDETLTSDYIDPLQKEITTTQGGSNTENENNENNIDNIDNTNAEDTDKVEEDTDKVEEDTDKVEEDTDIIEEDTDIIEEDTDKDNDINNSFIEPVSSDTAEETISDNIGIPSAVFDAKCLYHILNDINN